MRTNLRRYVLWKTVVALVLVFLVVTINFYLVEVIPNDPTRIMAPRGGDPRSAALRAQLISEWGLDKPLLDRYVIYVTNIFTGNWGTSISFRPGVDVWDVMAPRETDTFVLIGLAVFFAATIAMVLAPLLVRRRGGWGDGLGSLLALLSFAAPTFFLALSLQYLFVTVFPAFPAAGDGSVGGPALDPIGQSLDHAWHLVLPTLILTLALVGPFLLAVRRQWTVEPEEPAHGFARRLFRAVERTVPSVPLLWTWTLASVTFVEMVFGLHGLANLAFDSALFFDVPILAAIVLLFAFISVGVVTVLDVLHAVLAPRPEGLPSQSRPYPDRIELEDLGSTARHAFLRPLGILGLVLLLAIVVMTLEAPALGGPYPTPLQRFLPLLPPSTDHLLGTNRAGYDTWTVFVYGGELALTVAGEVFLVALALCLGLALTSGCLGRWVDGGVAVGLDLLLVLPWFPFLGLYASVAGRQPLELGAIVLLTLVCWPIPARLFRASVLGDGGSDPVRGAPWVPSVGAIVRRLWWLRGKVLGYAVMTSAISVLIVSALGFLGLVSSTHESWGTMISDSWTSLDALAGRWYAFVPPGLAILVLTYGLVLLAFTLRESGHRAAARSSALPAPSPAEGPEAVQMPPPEPAVVPQPPPTP